MASATRAKPQIVPSLTATNINEYNHQLDRVAGFAKRIHIDISDGQFAPVRLINLIQAYWPAHIEADIHLMVRKPEAETRTLISMRPHLVIVHTESVGNIEGMLKELSAIGIKVGIALLPGTPAEAASRFISQCQHGLIFSGNLGHYGGEADLSLLTKASLLKSLRPDLEIGWDGGVNDTNVEKLIHSGVDVLDVGGYIQQASNAEAAYDQLLSTAGARQ